MKSQLHHRYRIQHAETTDVYVGKDLLGHLSSLLKPYKHSAYLVLCDETTGKLFGQKVERILSKLGVPIFRYTLPVGEESKTLSHLESILRFMLQKDMDRKAGLIAAGGGVVGDLATVVASLYYRGVDCIQIPTTLLAQADSAMGGKGAVNVGTHKNTLGAISQPRAVIIDTSLPLSLPKAQFRSGMGEIAKYAIAMDRKLFERLEKNKTFDGETLTWIIDRCVKLKMRIVKKDPLDHGNRAILNFGHTLGHAIELEANLPHGEAISIGMAFAIRLSVTQGLLAKNSANRALSLLRKYNPPTTVNSISIRAIEANLIKDKKSVAGIPRFVLLKDIGQAVINQEVPAALIRKVLGEVLL